MDTDDLYVLERRPDGYVVTPSLEAKPALIHRNVLDASCFSDRVDEAIRLRKPLRVVIPQWTLDAVEEAGGDWTPYLKATS